MIMTDQTFKEGIGYLIGFAFVISAIHSSLLAAIVQVLFAIYVFKQVSDSFNDYDPPAEQ